MALPVSSANSPATELMGPVPLADAHLIHAFQFQVAISLSSLEMEEDPVEVANKG